jgi:hypothetical protein
MPNAKTTEPETIIFLEAQGELCSIILYVFDWSCSTENLEQNP